MSCLQQETVLMNKFATRNCVENLNHSKNSKYSRKDNIEKKEHYDANRDTKVQTKSNASVWDEYLYIIYVPSCPAYGTWHVVVSELEAFA